MASSFFTNLYADETAELLNAITVCPWPSNPLDGLKQLKGNLFTNVKTSPYLVLHQGVRIEATLVSNPQAYNERIMAPTRIVGSMIVTKGYHPRTGSLECVIEIVLN